MTKKLPVQAQRLRQARKQAGYRTMQDAAKAQKWSYATYKSHECGERGIRVKAATIYASVFRVTPGWILTGENPPPWETSIRSAKGYRPTRTIPKLTAKEAGQMMKLSAPFSALPVTTQDFITIDSRPEAGPKTYSRDVADDSMVANPPQGKDNFEIGESLIFDPDQKPKPGDYVDVLLQGQDEPIFRRFRPRGAHEGGAYELVPLNQNYPTELVTPDKPEVAMARLIGRHTKY